MSRLGLYTTAYLIFLYAPIFLLPLFAFNDSQTIAFPLDGFTPRWFTELTTIPALRDAVLNSLFIAITTAVLSTLLGLCAARAATRHDFPAKRPILGTIMVPLVLPEIIVAVALLGTLQQLFALAGQPLTLSLWYIVAAHTLICTPFSVAILNSAFQSLDPALEEAAVDLGETRASTFRRITLPLVTPGLIASLLIAFTISMDEFIIAFFLTGAETTLPVYIWSILRFPARLPVVMALGTILVAASVVILTLAEVARRRGIRRAGGRDTGGFL